MAVTVYRADLGLGDDFNKEYVGRYVEKISTMKDELKKEEDKYITDSKVYTELLDDTLQQINDYKMMIKNLEDLAEGYKMVLANNNTAVKKKQHDIVDMVKRLIGSHK